MKNIFEPIIEKILKRRELLNTFKLFLTGNRRNKDAKLEINYEQVELLRDLKELQRNTSLTFELTQINNRPCIKIVRNIAKYQGEDIKIELCLVANHNTIEIDGYDAMVMKQIVDNLNSLFEIRAIMSEIDK